MIVLDLPVLEGDVPGCALVCEVVAIGVLAPSSVGTGVRHLVVEVAVVAGYAAPPRGSSGAEEMGVLTVGGEVVKPRAVRTAAVFFIFVLC
jgi:hypothetical protein